MKRTYVRVLGAPREIRVTTDPTGTPTSVGGRQVDQLRDEWRVEEGWWTARPVRRVYFDLVMADGRNTVVFHDRRGGRWYAQRG